MGKAIKDKEAKEEVIETVETVEAVEATEEKAEELEKAEEYKIEAPNTSYSGLTATVEFKNGIGKTTNKVVADYFKARNYKVTAIK